MPALKTYLNFVTIHKFENTQLLLFPTILLVDIDIPSIPPQPILFLNHLAHVTTYPFKEDRFVLYSKVPDHNISPFGAHSEGTGMSRVPCQGRSPPVKGGSFLEYPVRS